ncbi:AbrB/MazE/SpoVT family DNA-binding domain-containing protein [Thermodesulfobacteriota bacterium]
MDTKLVQIGNSKGIRIPQKILNHCHMEDRITLSVQDDAIILKPLKSKPREGWDLAAKEMHAFGDDQLLIPDVLGDDTELDW